MDETQVPYTHDPKEPYNWVRVRMIGGKSNFWARMSFRLSDYEFKGKDHDGFGENWPISYSDLRPSTIVSSRFSASPAVRKGWLSFRTASS